MAAFLPHRSLRSVLVHSLRWYSFPRLGCAFLVDETACMLSVVVHGFICVLEQSSSCIILSRGRLLLLSGTAVLRQPSAVAYSPGQEALQVRPVGVGYMPRVSKMLLGFWTNALSLWRPRSSRNSHPSSTFALTQRVALGSPLLSGRNGGRPGTVRVHQCPSAAAARGRRSLCWSIGAPPLAAAQ